MTVREYILNGTNNSSLKGIKGIRKYSNLLDLEVESASDLDPLSTVFYPCFRIIHTKEGQLAYYYEARYQGEIYKYFTDNPIK